MQASRVGTCFWYRPQAPTSIRPSSKTLMARISRRLSSLSASCPEVALNSTKGRMKMAPITSPASAGGSQAMLSW